MTLFENCVYKGKGGGIIYREVGLKVNVIIAINEAFGCVFCNHTETQGGRSRK